MENGKWKMVGNGCGAMENGKPVVSGAELLKIGRGRMEGLGLFEFFTFPN
jgi:hypothetical protein